MANSIEVGNVYRMPNNQYVDDHFHIVVLKTEKPSNLILCVPFNSYEKLNKRLRDDSCVFLPQEIPNLLTRKSQLTYKKSIILNISDLEELLSNGDASFKCKINSTALNQIQIKLMQSRKTPRNIKDFYSDNKMFS